MQKRSREEWKRLVEAWTVSGESAQDFTKSRGLNARTLQWWRWRLRIDAKEDATLAPRFVPVTVENWVEPAPARNGLVEAGLPNGVTLRFEYRLDGAGLRELAGAFANLAVTGLSPSSDAPSCCS
jgi:hypothetical protein